MPKRSNPFQQIIFLVQNHVGGSASVTESEMLDDLVTGTPREVDVCIREVVGGHEVVVCLECRDHKRVQSVTWVQEMHDKHGRLPTNSLILVSSSGFTKEALTTAKSYGIGTVVPGQLTDEQAAELVGGLKSFWYRKFELKVTGAKVWVVDDDGNPLAIAHTSPADALFDEHGEVLGDLEGFVGTSLPPGDPAAFNGVNQDISGNVVFGYEQVELESGDGQRSGIFLRLLDPEPRLRRISRMEVHASASITASEFPLRYGEFNGTPFGAGESLINGKSAVLVVTMSGKERRISIKTPSGPLLP